MSKEIQGIALYTIAGEVNKPQTKRGRPPDPKKRKPDKTSQIGTKNNETRATFIVNEATLDKLKALAYWEREQIKDVLGTAIETHLNNYEKKNGKIKPIPKNKMSKEIQGVTLYTIEETAELLGITTTTVRNYIKAGKLSGQRIGRPYFVSQRAIKTFLEGDLETA